MPENPAHLKPHHQTQLKAQPWLENSTHAGWDWQTTLQYLAWVKIWFNSYKKKKKHILINLKKEQNTRSSHRLLGKVRITNWQEIKHHQCMKFVDSCSGETPDIYHCTCCRSSLTKNESVSSDRKCDEGENSLTWRMEHVGSAHSTQHTAHMPWSQLYLGSSYYGY